MTEADPPQSPHTKSARQQRIIDLVTHHEVRSQTELADLLAAHGLQVTQATLSRDLVELDAVKVRSASGALVYAVPGEGGDRTPAPPHPTAGGRASARPAVRRAAGHARRRVPTWWCCARRRAPRSSWPRRSTRPSSPGSSAPSPGDDTVLVIGRERRRRRRAGRSAPRPGRGSVSADDTTGTTNTGSALGRPLRHAAPAPSCRPCPGRPTSTGGWRPTTSPAPAPTPSALRAGRAAHRRRTTPSCMRGLDVLATGTPPATCVPDAGDEDVHGALERLLLDEVGSRASAAGCAPGAHATTRWPRCSGRSCATTARVIAGLLLDLVDVPGRPGASSTSAP